jgi:choline dehydrogenase-like flavoprotein
VNAASNSERPEGEPVSLWIATAGTTDYPILRGDMEVDVAVIGAGIAGLTAPLALKRTGHIVAVIEAARAGTGVSGHTTGKVTSLHRLAYTDLYAATAPTPLPGCWLTLSRPIPRVRTTPVASVHPAKGRQNGSLRKRR